MPQMYDLLQRATNPTPNDPGRRPLYKPFEKNMLGILLEAVQGGWDPESFLGSYQGIHQGALDRLASRREATQERRGMRADMLSGLGSQLTEAALGGVPATGLEALVNVQTAANPMLGNVAPGRLEDLIGSAGELAGSLPTLEAEALPLTVEDIAGIDKDIALAATGQEKQASGLPMGLHEITMAIVGQLRLQGYAEDQLEQVRQYIAAKWTELGGPQPGGGPSGLTEPQLADAARTGLGGIGGLPWETNDVYRPFG